ncbi:MAG: DNA primase [Patescibacteria group bacterium]|jgi:DNA primase
MDQKDEIKSRLDLIEVIREYVPLKAVGVNFQARCPFHREKTPSFVVSPERQIWKCFGCGKGGDVFSFVMEMEGLSFVEALRQLAPKAGVQLKSYNPQESSRRNRLLDIMELAAAYYHKLLTESADAKSALDYLKRRGLEDETIERWQIGYSRDSWDDVLKFLKNKRFSEQEIFLSGLAVKKENANSYYDRFRGRIMFPINDYNGSPVAFSARVSPEKEATEKMGKYINSPQTPIYDKSRILFGLDKAKQYIRELETAVIVEGQMDAISSHQAGVKNVVASSGTALSPEQVKLIKRYANNFLFAFDSDAAGGLATDRGEAATRDFVDEQQRVNAEDRFGRIRKYIDPTLSHDINIKIIQIPGGKDPDECIRKNSEIWKQAINKAVSAMDYYFNKTFLGLDLSDVGNKKKAAAKMLKAIMNIKNVVERDSWLRKLADKLEVNEWVLREAITRQKQKSTFKNGPVKNIQPEKNLQNSISQLEMLSESALAIILKFPQHLSHIVNYIKPEMLAGEAEKIFYKKLIIYYNNGAGNTSLFDSEDFKLWLKNNIEDEQELANLEELVNILLLLADKDFYELDINKAKIELNKIINQIKRKYLTRKMLGIESQLSLAEKDNEKQKIRKLSEEFKAISEEMRNLDYNN